MLRPHCSMACEQDGRTSKYRFGIPVCARRTALKLSWFGLVWFGSGFVFAFVSVWFSLPNQVRRTALKHLVWSRFGFGFGFGLDVVGGGWWRVNAEAQRSAW